MTRLQVALAAVALAIGFIGVTEILVRLLP
jgi:hypothetical protein